MCGRSAGVLKPRRVNPWLFAQTPESVSRVRLTERLAPGTLIAHQACTGTYVGHERGGLPAARGIVARALPGGWALAIMREATVIGPLLNGGRGVDAQACVELRAAGVRVIL